MSRYAKGARLERLARRELERLGYAVIRSAGSKGAVDLVAFSPRRILLVQVKGGRVTSADRQKLAAFPAPKIARRQLWQRANGAWQVSEQKRKEK